MSNITNLLSTSTSVLKYFKAAGRIADQHNYNAYVIGGYVRDTLLNKNPSKDIDITVNKDYKHYAECLAKELKIKDVVFFEQFKTAKLINEDAEFEITQMRKETYNSESRNPKVEEASLKDDLLRRDFTINAIAMSLNKKDFGDIEDHLGGIKDLNKGIIITPLDPDETFSDDPLRMLRALRFAARLNFQIAPNIIDSIERMNERIKIISAERITDEIIKILKTDKPSIAFYLLKDTGLLKYIFPELDIMSGIETINGKDIKMFLFIPYK